MTHESVEALQQRIRRSPTFHPFDQGGFFADHRWHPHLPSEAIASLRAVDASLYSESNHLFCPHIPDNMVGGLILASKQEDFLRIYQKYGRVPPKRVLSPIEVHSRVPIYVFDEEKGQYTRADGLEAQAVLMQQMCGPRAGIVTEGALSGLLVSPSKQIEEGLVAVRVFNDFRYTADTWPYAPNLHSDVHEDEEGPAYYGEALRLYGQTYREANSRLIEGNQWVSEAFFALCEEQGIAVDTQQFHLSRDPQELIS